MQVAVYCRVSTEDQAETKTIENQTEFAQRYCDLHEIPIHDLYLDNGITGTIALDQRPEGKRLLSDAAAGKFDLVLIYRVDRLARSTLHLLMAHEQLEALGVGLRSMTEPFDTSTPTGKFVMTMLASIAALERDTIVERMSLGRERKARMGKWTGGKPPFGYHVTSDRYLQIYEPEAEIIRLVFNLYVRDRMSTIAIVDYLNARSIPTIYQAKGVKVQTRGKWDAAVLSRILRNSTYRGLREYRKGAASNKESISQEVPTIIDEKQWLEAQSLLQRNLWMADRNSTRQYLLRGLIKCGACGRIFTGGHCIRKGRHYVYYRCTTNAGMRGKSQPRCVSTSVRGDFLEELVWNDVCRFVENPEPVIALLQEKVNEKLHQALPVEEEADHIEAALVTKSGERERVIGLYSRGLITDSESEKQLLSLQSEIEALTRRKEALLSQSRELELFASKAVTARQLLAHLRDKLKDADFSTQRELVESLVDYIRVDMDEVNGKRQPRLTVIYRFDAPESPVFNNSAHPKRCTRIATGSRIRSRIRRRKRWSGRCRTGTPMPGAPSCLSCWRR